ncbi:MAG TPA: alpha-N-acetylglucosaminidase TIM-barrel domain-containing protein [Verrucomicrobiae bacterium]|nr:alpha-N-acetylglucosaminidase TIM-barrel domain-containing protein [Verrucomicrobiae bacterium]
MRNQPTRSCSGVIFWALALAAAVASAERPTPSVLVPPAGEPAYRIAGEVFCDMWGKVTGAKPSVATCASPDDGKLPPGDIVLIGSDAVNPVVHRLILQSRIENLGIRYGADEYRILSLSDGGRTLLVLAGGAGRSTIYAAYDFFRRRAGAEYFWDGDVIPKRAAIDLAGCDITERAHFAYRGLRYFAHRGPHRFHAEQWDLEDWKREIDWILKKRMNLFMLRTGIDDLFQRAFGLPYPPEDGVDPDAEPRSYNDRTSFWPLKYRGELRKRVLAYARERGLIHPEDTGTITHWYSHTPGSFYEKFPDFPVTRDQKTGYKLASAAIWDIEHERTWDAYWKLTETHIREFGDPRIFHTIGLAERRFGSDERENLQRKLHAYRKIQEVLRRRYPDAPLLIASWDLMGWWKDEDVQRLLGEFDPQKTILLDYTADLLDRKTYRDWEAYKKFPWIFGVFHAFAADSEMREDYSILKERIGDAAGDPQCLGLVLWPEISHSNTLLLEYLAANGWRPDQLDAGAFVGRFCAGRYPAKLAADMEGIWRPFLPVAATHHWTHPTAKNKPTGPAVQFDPQFRILSSGEYTNLNDERARLYVNEVQRLAGPLRDAPAILDQLARLADASYADDLWRRDAIDIARTIINRGLKASLLRGCVAMEAWRSVSGDGAAVRRMETVSKGLMQQLGELLALSDDFSLDATVKRLQSARELDGVFPRLNPHTEETLKGNSENSYCRAHQYELVRHVYQPELEEYWKWVGGQLQSPQKKPWSRPAAFTAARKTIQDHFYATPLIEMAPQRQRSADSLRRTLGQTRDLLETLLASSP